jgi:signal transduction histidine kinase
VKRAPAAGRWSLRTRLVSLLAIATLAAWAASSVWLYRRAVAETDRLFDAALVEAAHAVLAVVAHESGDRRGRDHGDDEHADDEIELEAIDHAHAESIFYQVRNRRGAIVFRSAGAPVAALASAGARGFADRTVDGAAWRVYSLATPRGRAQIDVGQRLADRRALARGGALRLLVPGVALVLLLAAGAWLIVRRVTAPVVDFSRAIDARAPGDSTPVATERLPSELAPVGAAVNRLLARAEAALRHERTLTADAAHELRTPLAAMRAQAQVALRASDEAERSAALRALIGAVDRATRGVDAVLALARLDATEIDRTRLPAVDLRRLCGLLVDEAAPQIDARGIAVEVAVADEARALRADADALAILLRNLLDNALRHARSRVRIEAARGGERIVLAVRDDGPGLTPEQAERAFDRFYRGTEGGASGLGLALVRRIAELHHGRTRIGTGLDGAGVGFEVDLPVQ